MKFKVKFNRKNSNVKLKSFSIVKPKKNFEIIAYGFDSEKRTINLVVSEEIPKSKIRDTLELFEQLLDADKSNFRNEIGSVFDTKTWINHCTLRINDVVLLVKGRDDVDRLYAEYREKIKEKEL